MTACCVPGFEIHNSGKSYDSPLVTMSVAFGPGFADTDLDAMTKGFNIWSSQTNGQVIWEQIPLDWAELESRRGMIVSDGRCHLVVVVELALSTDAFIQKFDKEHSNTRTVGVAHRDECGYSRIWIVVDRLDMREQVKIVTAHEVGHVLGIDHLESSVSLMFHSSKEGRNMCITYDDMKAFCDLYGCNPNETSYCIPHSCG